MKCWINKLFFFLVWQFYELNLSIFILVRPESFSSRVYKMYPNYKFKKTYFVHSVVYTRVIVTLSKTSYINLSVYPIFYFKIIPGFLTFLKLWMFEEKIVYVMVLSALTGLPASLRSAAKLPTSVHKTSLLLLIP
jgi:hypothetical protein